MAGAVIGGAALVVACVATTVAGVAVFAAVCAAGVAAGAASNAACVALVIWSSLCRSWHTCGCSKCNSGVADVAEVVERVATVPAVRSLWLSAVVIARVAEVDASVAAVW